MLDSNDVQFEAGFEYLLGSRLDRSPRIRSGSVLLEDESDTLFAERRY